MPDEGAEGPGPGATAGSGAGATIEDWFSEDRRFPPSSEFTRQAVVDDPAVYRRAEEAGPDFWAEQAGALDWFRPWDRILEWDLPFARWFVGGTLNVSYNCLDRHVAAGRGDKVAFHWEGEPGDTRTVTYGQLLEEVCRFANVLHALGTERGDRVAIYMPMIPELPVAMLACTRIGAAHSVVFGGFSAEALRDRILDAEAKVVVTADGGWRRGTPRSSQAPGGRSRLGDAIGHPCGGGATHHSRGASAWIRPRGADDAHDRGPRPLVGRAHVGTGSRRWGRASEPVRARAHGLRGPALSAVHVGDHSRPQGHHAHDRRLPDPGGLHPPGGLRPPPRDATSTGARPTSGG